MVAKINKEWHLKHPMPKNPTLDQRVQWHLEHARECHCREMPESVLKELKKRKIKLTARA
jgi:hypothetical protein